MKLIEVSPRGIHAVFETLRSVLHSGKIAPRVQYMIEVMFAIRKDQFKVWNISHVMIDSSHYLTIFPFSLSLPFAGFVRTILQLLKSLTLFKRTTRSLTFSPLMMNLTQRRHSVSSWSSDGVTTVSNLTHTHSHTHTSSHIHIHSDVFHPDPDFLANEDKYKLIKEGIAPQPKSLT